MAVFTAFAATTIGTFLTTTIVGNLLLSTGLSLLSQALIGKPKTPQQVYEVNTTLRAGGEVPRSIGFGNYATAGSLVYVNTWGGNNRKENLTMVIALADIPNVSLTHVYVDGVKVTLGSVDGNLGNLVTEYRKDNQNYLWVKFLDGTQTSADTLLTNSVSNGERPYGSNRIGKGVAYAIVTMRINRDLFSGVPQFVFQLRGRAYDPRQDTSVGGSGSQRIDNISTWGNGPEADNPVVQIYNILRGVRYEGSWLYGLQRVSPSQLPLSDWFDQMDKAELTVLESTGNVAQYRSGGEIVVETPIADIIDNILTTCSGRLSEVGGAYKIKIGAPDAPVIAFTDGDVVSTSGQVFSPFFGLADLVNGLETSYPDPSQAWNMQAAPPLFNPTAEVEDGNRRLMAQVDMFFSPYPEQVQRLMKQALLDARNSRQHALTLGPQYWPLEPGDVVQWTSERNGYVNKLFRVDAVSDLYNGDVVVNITEVDPSDYSWDTGTEFTPVAEGNLNFVSRPDLPIDPQNWSVQTSDLRDPQNTARRPAIILNWPTDYSDIDRVEFQVRLDADKSFVSTGLFSNFPSGSGLITEGLLPVTNYEVRARLIATDGQRSPWIDWLFVQSGAGFFGDGDFSGGVKGLFQDAGLSAPEIVNALPSTGNFQGRIVFLTTDNKLYRHTGSPTDETGWTKTFDGVDIVDGSIVASDKLFANTITGGLLATSGIITDSAQIENLVVERVKLGLGSVSDFFSVGQAVSTTVTPYGDWVGAGFTTTITIPSNALEAPQTIVIRGGVSTNFSTTFFANSALQTQSASMRVRVFNETLNQYIADGASRTITTQTARGGIIPLTLGSGGTIATFYTGIFLVSTTTNEPEQRLTLSVPPNSTDIRPGDVLRLEVEIRKDRNFTDITSVLTASSVVYQAEIYYR